MVCTARDYFLHHKLHIIMKLKEIWRDVVGYEGLYQVSNWGRVKSYLRGKERILKPVLENNGYYSVNLYKKGKLKKFSLHRLVVETFLGEISSGLVVNHLNEIKTDNRLENLEIVTQRENVNHGTRNMRISEALKGQKFSEEHKRKISEGRKAYLQRRREA